MAKNKVFIFVPEGPVRKALEQTVGLLFKPEDVRVSSDLNELQKTQYGLVIDASPMVRVRNERSVTIPKVDYLENVPTVLADVAKKISDYQKEQ